MVRGTEKEASKEGRRSWTGHRAISEERSETDGKTTDETKLDRWTSGRGRNGCKGDRMGGGQTEIQLNIEITNPQQHEKKYHKDGQTALSRKCYTL